MQNSLADIPGFFRAIVQGSFDAIVVTEPSGRVRFWNAQAAEAFGFSAAVPESLNIFRQIVPNQFRSDGGIDFKDFVTSASTTTSKNWQRLEFEVLRSDNRQIWIDLRVSHLVFNDENLAVLVIRDIDEQKRIERELQHQATTDYLSGISNRREFQRLLESHVGSNICLAIIDIDSFKSINDQYGHPVGDQAIRFVANRLVSTFKSALSIARLGGEEFGVLLSIGHEFDGFEVFDALRAELTEEIFSEHSIGLTISVGVSLQGDEVLGARELLTRADSALYESKNAGRNRVTVFSKTA